MAGEFGISVDEVITLLRQMDVPVRSHVSPLTDDQVARIRARWEREKRARATAPAAAPSRRRRGAAAPVDTPPAPVAETPAEASGTRRRRRAAETPAPSLETTTETPVAVEPPLPGAGIIDKAAKAKEAAKAAAPAPAAEERQAYRADEALSPRAADAAAPPMQRPAAPASTQPPATLTPLQPAAPVSSLPQSAGGASERPRPRPVVPGAPRPRPVATGTPYTPPRPVASAAPGAATGFPGARRDDRPRPDDRGGRRGKKGKRGSVDQEAVSSSISRTMTALRGPAAVRRPGSRRSDDASYREEVEADRIAAVEREKKTVHVNEFITVSELAGILKVPATQIVGFAFKNLGLMITINQRLDFDQIDLIAGEFGFQAMREEEYAAGVAEATEKEPWDTSITARRRFLITSGRRTSSRASRAGSRSTSARTT